MGFFLVGALLLTSVDVDATRPPPHMLDLYDSSKAGITSKRPPPRPGRPAGRGWRTAAMRVLATGTIRGGVDGFVRRGGVWPRRLLKRDPDAGRDQHPAGDALLQGSDESRWRRQRLRARGREPDDAAGLVDLVPGETEDLARTYSAPVEQPMIWGGEALVSSRCLTEILGREEEHEVPRTRPHHHDTAGCRAARGRSAWHRFRRQGVSPTSEVVTAGVVARLGLNRQATTGDGASAVGVRVWPAPVGHRV